MSKALYRKYRPTQLSDVIGQEQITTILENNIKQNKISHAYLFIGPRGTGKTSVARIFAHAINKFKYEIEDNYIDIIEIDGASNRGIDDIRELREKANIAPTEGKYKIYIIDEVHMLTKEAFNALLKTLEEPPKHVVFIMATTDAHKVPITITSRAQSYTFKLADQSTMANYLQNVAQKEHINITPEAIDIIVKKGGGSFRDSLSLLDQISTISQKEITKDLVVSVMGLPDDEKITHLLTEYTDGNVVKITTLIKEFLSSGIKAEFIAEELISHIIESPNPAYISLLSKLTEVKSPFSEAKLLLALIENQNVNPAPVQTVATKPFNWSDFLEDIRKKSDLIYTRLQKSEHEYANGVLNIYPSTKAIKTILETPNNLRIIKETIKDTNVIIHNVDKKPSKNDKSLNKISDIMGGEVKNYGGENPFK